LARAIGRREAVIFLLLNLGEIAGIRGDYRQAKTYLREGLALAQEIGHQRAEIAARQYLGVVAYQQGEDAPAAAYFGDGLRLAREIGYQEKISALLLHRGALALEQGQTAQAERQLQEGLALARKLAHAELICLALRYLSDAAVHRKAYKQARQYLEEGLTLARESGFSLSIIGMLQAWGHYHLAQAEWEAAAGVFTELLNLAQKAEAQGAVALALYGLARVNAAQGKGEQARLQEKESAAILTRIGHRRARFRRCTGD
jgi:tetratricopeptide (TPR) repeat protein